MTLDTLVAKFAELTGDAISIGFRAPEDEEAHLVWFNQAFVDLFGYDPEELMGAQVSIIHDPEFIPELYEKVKPRFAAGETFFKVEVNNRTRDGRMMWMSMSLFVVPVQGGRYSVATYRDLTDVKERDDALVVAEEERKHAALETQRAQDRLLAAINASSGPMSIWNPEWKLIAANNAFRKYASASGLPELQKMNFLDVLSAFARTGVIPNVKTPEEQAAWVERSARSLRDGPMTQVNTFADGSIMQTSTQWSDAGDMFVISTDITNIEMQRKRLKEYSINIEQAHIVSQHQALHDELTGLGNRRFLNEALERLGDRRKKEGGEIHALHVDLDRFKQVNDTQGHKLGDALLKRVSQVLVMTAQSTDVVTRIGGDEFLIVRYSKDTPEPADLLAQKIVEALSKPLIVLGQDVRIGASVGLAATDISDLADLLVNSDVALYKAKSKGRNRFEPFMKSDLAEVERVKRLSDEILSGLEQKAFIPVYQPQVCAATGALLGFEALARWRRENGEIWAPDTFLKIAEELNIVERIDEMIFEMAMQEVPPLFKHGEIPSLSFNVSEVRLMSPGLIRDAKRAAEYAGEVSFELLESVFMDDDDPAMGMQIDTLKDIGVGVEIDDFGSGHASIIGLEQVAPSRLKIDRRLIAPITQSRKSWQMVRSIVEIGQALDIGIIAEGVETEEHASLLKEMGVDRLQGFLFSRPMPISDIPGVCARLAARADRMASSGFLQGQRA